VISWIFLFASEFDAADCVCDEKIEQNDRNLAKNQIKNISC